MQVFAMLELREGASKEVLSALIKEEESYLWRDVVSDRSGMLGSLRAARRNRVTGGRRSRRGR